MTGRDLVMAAKARVRDTTADQLKQRLDGQQDLLVLDVREGDEAQAGMIPGAVWLPRGFLEIKVEALESRRDRPVVVYCAGGFRSALAADTLQQMGYSQVENLAGGFKAWADSGFPIRRP